MDTNHHKMMDKNWADLQSKNNQNANAFFGGTVEALTNLTYFNEWPTGAPPLLQVCELRLSLTPPLTHCEVNDTLPNEGMFPANTITDMLNIKGNVLCYEYQ